LTTFDADAYVYEAMKAGASGFLLKDLRPEELAGAVRTVADGGTLLAEPVTRRMIERFVRRPQPEEQSNLDELTGREREVLELIARGCSNAEIGSTLFLTEATVKTHVTHVLRKLGLRDRVQAVIYAYEAGLVEPGAAK
jgi:DNA-binding NarL/FixJ family response regulator